jgi:carbonic anhydrase
MKKVMSGLAKFQDETFPQNRDLFERLASGQSPETLFITCSDSRIDPCMLTHTKPGDIFICRNAGNIVPAYGEVIGGVSATIEYAVLALGVKDIILCGHSDCGAMRALLNPQSVAQMPAVSAWLRYGESARFVVQENHSHLSGADLLNAMIEQNVLAQLDNLRTHPAVSARLAKGQLNLHGWAYDIGSGQVRAFDPAQASFVPVEERVPAMA